MDTHIHNTHQKQRKGSQRGHKELRGVCSQIGFVIADLGPVPRASFPLQRTWEPCLPCKLTVPGGRGVVQSAGSMKSRSEGDESVNGLIMQTKTLCFLVWLDYITRKG